MAFRNCEKKTGSLSGTFTLSLFTFNYHPFSHPRETCIMLWKAWLLCTISCLTLSRNTSHSPLCLFMLFYCYTFSLSLCWFLFNWSIFTTSAAISAKVVLAKPQWFLEWNIFDLADWGASKRVEHSFPLESIWWIKKAWCLVIYLGCNHYFEFPFSALMLLVGWRLFENDATFWCNWSNCRIGGLDKQNWE